MKKLYTVLLSIIFVNLGIAQINPFVQDIITKINIDSLTKFVSQLSGQEPVIVNGQTVTITTRYYSSASNDKAADFIKAKFESYGLQAFNQNFSSGRNVYGVQTGTTYPDDVYIICAHYDDMPSSGLAPGADDNASGSAAVLEAARVLKDYLFKYTIIYAVWDAEEMGLIGSDYYASNAFSNGENILGVLNFDMIAYDSNNDNLSEIHTKNIANSVALKDSMLKVNTVYSIGITPFVINPGISASDHASFWNFNYSAILLIENYYGDFNAYYHSANDLLSHFNFPYYHKCSKLGIGTLSLLASVEGPLPVEFAGFAGAWNGSNVTLNWITATETNNLGFEVERKYINEINSSGWYTIGFVAGSGNKSIPSNYSFTDSRISTSGKYFFRLKQIDYNGSFEYSPEIEVDISLLNTFALEQNYPNPFNPTTTIGYSLTDKTQVKLSVVNTIGEEVALLVNEEKGAGFHSAEFNSESLPSGVYFYTLQAGSFVATKKMILMR